MRSVFSSAAERDVKRALDYYRAEAGASVANDFVLQLEAKVILIERSPKSYRVVVHDLRCANLDRFPYQIVYRIVKDSIVRSYPSVIISGTRTSVSVAE